MKAKVGFDDKSGLTFRRYIYLITRVKVETVMYYLNSNLKRL